LRTAKKTAEASFWDSSGLVLLCTPQRASRDAIAIRRVTGPLVLWWGTRVEAQSAFARLHREGLLDVGSVTEAVRKLEAFEHASWVIEPDDDVRDAACRLVDANPLRAGDALQLAAALTAVGHKPHGRVFVTFDQRLAEIARAGGFDLRP